MVFLTKAVVVSTVLLFSARSSAQTSIALRSGDRFIGAWVGASVYSPVGAHLGQTPDRKLFLTGLHSEWVLEDFDQSALMTTLDLIPLVIVTNNPTYREERTINSDGAGRIKVQTGSSPVYGAGVTPFGLKAISPPFKRARIFLASSVGCLWFTRDTPVPDSRSFNFTFDYGGGVQLKQSHRQSVIIGYRFHHLSNAYTAPRNPGLDGNVFYISVLRRR